MNQKHKEAREFFDKMDSGIKIFDVTWCQKTTWHVIASSREEAEKVAKVMRPQETFFEDPEVSVSGDLVALSKIIANKFSRKAVLPEPNSGVAGNEIVHIDEYLARRTWDLICEVVDKTMVCVKCGHEDWVLSFNLNSKLPKYGYMPEMGCPKCGDLIDWRELVKQAEGGVDGKKK